MPVHDLGYREWKGERLSRLLRPMVVAKGGVSLIWRHRWLRLALIFAWLPIVIFGVLIFMFEYSMSQELSPQVVAQLVAFPPFSRPDLALQILTEPEAARHPYWSTMILTFFRVPQLVAMVLLVGLIAPMLVSYDLRSKAYLMYFSRPLSVGQYILGKSAVIWFFLFMITTVPALAMYVVSVFMSPDLSVIAETWDIPLRIFAATFVLVVPTTALALCYSSFTTESRYATFGWFATWVLGLVAYFFLTFSINPGQNRRPPTRQFQRARAEVILREDLAQEIVVGDATTLAIQNGPPEIQLEQFAQGDPFSGEPDFGPGEFQPRNRDQFGGPPTQGNFRQRRGRRPRFRSGGFGPEDLEQIQARMKTQAMQFDLDKWRLVSPFHTLGKVQAWIFGADNTPGSVVPSIVSLLTVTIFCCLIIRRRILARLSI